MREQEFVTADPKDVQDFGDKMMRGHTPEQGGVVCENPLTVVVTDLDWYDYGNPKHPSSVGSVVDNLGFFCRIMCVGNSWVWAIDWQTFLTIEAAKKEANKMFKNYIKAGCKPTRTLTTHHHVTWG